MDLTNWQYRKITDFCNVERAASGKKYKAGSCFIKLRAVDEFVGQIKETGTIDSGYAVFEPYEALNTDYLFIVIEKAFPDFLRRYRTTINLQFDTLKHFTIPWHEEPTAQEYVVSRMKTIQEEIELVQKKLKREQEIKTWHLAKMMV